MHLILRKDLAESLQKYLNDLDDQWKGKSIKFDTWSKKEIEEEYKLIQEKKSKFSSAQRKKISEIWSNLQK